MIPPGHKSVPEAVNALQSRGTDEPDVELMIAVRRGQLPLFTDKAGTIYRIPQEDAERFYIVRERENEFSAWRPWQRSPRWRYYLGSDASLTLFIAEGDLSKLLGDLSKSLVPKSGTRGRPSRMDAVLREHNRRRQAGQCEGSRMKEAKALHDWCKHAHSHEKPPSVDTIRKRLPSDFQPAGN